MENIEEIFNSIYEKTRSSVLKYIVVKCLQTEDIEDIMQEVYVELYSTLMKKGRSYIHDEKAFLLRIAKTKVYKHYSIAERIKNVLGRRQTLEDVEVENMELSIPGVEEIEIDRLTLEEIAKQIGLKDDMTKRVFFLHYTCDMTIAEIAREMNVTDSFVKNRLYRTIRELRDIYGREGGANQ